VALQFHRWGRRSLGEHFHHHSRIEAGLGPSVVHVGLYGGLLPRWPEETKKVSLGDSRKTSGQPHVFVQTLAVKVG
jgi:hypothetical protein